jgi:hypothetical protein
MYIKAWFVLGVVLGMSVACAPLVQPTPIPTPTRILIAPVVSATPTVVVLPVLPLLPTPVGNSFAPPYVPACQGAQNLDQPMKLPWEIWDESKLQRVIIHSLESNWTYYRCSQSLKSLTAFYRQTMPLSPYDWLEDSAEEHDEGTLLIYNDSKVSVTPGFRWVYLALLPEKSNANISYLIATWWNAPWSC